jgi:hypothetical protein
MSQAAMLRNCTDKVQPFRRLGTQALRDSQKAGRPQARACISEDVTA